jgi:hypothetical protein
MREALADKVEWFERDLTAFTTIRGLQQAISANSATHYVEGAKNQLSTYTQEGCNSDLPWLGSDRCKLDADSANATTSGGAGLPEIPAIGSMLSISVANMTNANTANTTANTNANTANMTNAANATSGPSSPSPAAGGALVATGELPAHLVLGAWVRRRCVRWQSELPSLRLPPNAPASLHAHPEVTPSPAVNIIKPGLNIIKLPDGKDLVAHTQPIDEDGVVGSEDAAKLTASAPWG